MGVSGADGGSEPDRGDRLLGSKGDDPLSGSAADDALIDDGGALVVEDADKHAFGGRDLLFA